MTKEEFEALGITRKDLVCVIDKYHYKQVGSLFGNVVDDPIVLYATGHSKRLDIPRSLIPLDEVVHITIIQKDFWHD